MSWHSVRGNSCIWASVGPKSGVVHMFEHTGGNKNGLEACFPTVNLRAGQDHTLTILSLEDPHSEG